MRRDELFSKKLRKQLNPLWIFALLLSLCYSCKDTDSNEGAFDPNAPVEVNSIVPETGAIALPLVISGKNFGTDKSKVKVFFDEIQAAIITVKNNYLYVLNPRQTDGEHTVKVIVNGKEGVMEKKFNYIVTSSVRTVAGSMYNNDLGSTPLETAVKTPRYIEVDDKHNLVVFCVTASNDKELKLISLEENKISTLSNVDDIGGLCFNSDYSFLYAGRDNTSMLATQWDCNSNWSSINITSPDISEATMVVLDKEDNPYFIGFKGGLFKRDHKTGNTSKVGDVPKKFLPPGTRADGYLYAAYNPKDNYIYISSPKRGVIFRIDLSKTSFNDEADFEIYAGILSELGYNNGPRESAIFGSPRGLAFDSRGNMYVADGDNNVIRMIDTNGIVSTLTGKFTSTGAMGGYKDGSLEEALFFNPYDLAIDPNDIIYVADYYSNKVRCISIQ